MPSTFNADLEFSKISEAKVINYLNKLNAKNIITCNDKRYDISFLLKEVPYTIEVKHDRQTIDTGNVAIEYESRGRKSGIATSKASIWCYAIEDKLYFAPTNKVRKFLQENKFRHVRGGDDKTSRMYLVPFKRFIEVFEERQY